MKICIIGSRYFPNIKGGGEVSLKILSEALVKRGIDVFVITFDGEEKKEEVISNVRIIRYPRIIEIAQPLTLIPQVLMAMRDFEQETDLFHMYNMSTIPGGSLYKLLGGRKPVLATLNSYVGFCPIGSAICIAANMRCNFINKIKCINSRKMAPKIFSLPYAVIYPLLTSLSKKLDRYIAPSKVVKQMYVRQRYRADKIEVVPYFIPKMPTINKNNERQAFNILYVGALDVHKGVDILIQAFSYVARYHKDVNLIIVGNGPEFERYIKLVSDLGIYDRVYFAGKVSEPWKYYQLSDVFVHPAIWFEPFGRTILEALSFQLPVIASNMGAPPEIIKDAGLVFEKGDVNDLVRKLNLVIENDEMRERMKSRCSVVLEEYSPEKLLSKTIRVYEKVLGQ